MALKPLLAGTLLAALAAPVLAQNAVTPDFSGTWERYPQGGESGDPALVSPPIPDPPLKQEYKAAWQAKQDLLAARIAESQPPGDNYVHCIPDGMPAMMMGMFPMEIFQRPEQINITQEAFSQTRRIYMGETLPKWDEVDPAFYGHSVGRWEGDTLLIETTGVKQNVEFRWTPHSEAMKITERIHLIAPDILRDEIVVDDDYFEKPWAWSFTYRRTPDYKLLEYVCEDNRDVIDEQGHHTLRLDEE